MHGFIVWAVGLLVGAALVASAAGGLIRTGMQAGAALAGSAAPADYAFDYLMRPAVAATVPATVPPAAPPAAGAAPQPQPMIWRLPTAQELQPSIVRIFADGLQAGTLPARDRAYLASLVSMRTGLAPADAEKRVDEAFQEAKDAELKVRAAADKARKASLLAAFLAAATLAIGCAAACAGAVAGGRHRDEQTEIRLFGTKYFW